MSRRLSVLGLIPVFLLIGGCGGSTHSSSSTTTATASSTPSKQAGSTRGHRRGGTATVPAGSGGATNVRVPATFVVHPGEHLVPPVVSVPAFFAIQLTVASGDGRAHTVVLRGRTTVTLKVPANGRRSALVPGLRNGQYPLIVDGASRGSLMIGGEPGP